MAKATEARIAQLLRYDAESGALFWLPRPESMFPDKRSFNTWNSRFAGKQALNTPTNYGYLYGSIDGRPHLAHRVIWVLQTGKYPDGGLDHIDGVRSNNRWGNLRDVTCMENSHNQRLRADSKTGVPGVSRRRDKWVARIKVNYKSYHLGVFDTIEEATAARKEAERQHHFHPNHGKVANHG